MTAVPRIESVRGDITTQEVDAIVNAANEHFTEGGGVCGAIFQAAGADLLAEACAELGSAKAGEARATPAFGLPARWVIHAVGPRWTGGGFGEELRLSSAYRRSLEVADELGARSIAFPAISTGIYGYPSAQAARVAVRTLRSTPTQVELIRLVAFDEETDELYRSELAATAGP